MSPDKSGRYNRRRFLTALGAAGAVAVAGCSDDGEQTDGDDTLDPGAGDDDGGQEGEDAGGEEADGTEDTDSEDANGTENGEEENGAAEDAQYELRISVMDTEQGAIDGASVDIEDEDGEDAHDTTLETDMEGQATVELPDGMYTAHIRADGFVDAEEPVTIGGADEELLVQLEAENGAEESGEEDG